MEAEGGGGVKRRKSVGEDVDEEGKEKGGRGRGQGGGREERKEKGWVKR